MSAISFSDRRPQIGQMSQELLSLIADHRRTVEGTGLASGTRFTTTDTGDFTNHDCKGLLAFLNITVASGTGGLRVRLRNRDPVSNGSTVAQPTGGLVVTATITTVLFYPGIVAVPSFYLGFAEVGPSRTFYLSVEHGDASSYTYSLGYCLIP